MRARAPRYWLSSFAVLAVLLATVVAAFGSGPNTLPGFPAVIQPPTASFLTAVSPVSATWTPPFIFSDEAVTVELDLTGAVADEVLISTGGVLTPDAVLPAPVTVFPELGIDFIQLFDDGSNGDTIPGDGIWSRSGITVTGTITHDGGTHQEVIVEVSFFETSGLGTEFASRSTGERVSALYVVDASQRGAVTFTELEAGQLFGTSHALFLIDDGSFFPDRTNIFALDTLNVCEACRILIERFGDVFDFVLLGSDGILPGDQRDLGALAFHTSRRNDVEGIGRDVRNSNLGAATLSDGSPFNTFSAGRLRGIIFNNAPSGSPLAHEIMHQWALPEDRFLVFLDGTGHYVNNSDIVGIMDTGRDAFRIEDGPRGDFVSNGDGTFRLVPRPGLDPPTFSPISRYLAGFVPPSQVPPITTFGTIQGVGPNRSIANPNQIIVGDVVTETIGDFIDTFGTRVPTSATAPRDFTLGALIVGTGPFTEAEYTWFTLVLRYFESNKPYDGFGPAPWQSATRGLSTLTTALPGQQQPEPEPEEPEPPLTGTISYPIGRGFNLVGWMGGTAVEDATASLNADFDTLFAFDPATGSFSTFSPTAPGFLNSLDELDAGMGLWVLSSGAGQWEMPLPAAPLSIPLVRGFNLVVWSGEDGIATQDAVASLGSALNAIFVWDPTTQSFLSFSPSAPSFLNDADILFLGEGVWVNVSRNVTWNQGG